MNGEKNHTKNESNRIHLCYLFQLEEGEAKAQRFVQIVRRKLMNRFQFNSTECADERFWLSN